MKIGLKKNMMKNNYRIVIVLLACIVPVLCADAQAWLICNEGFSSRVPQGWTVAPASTVANRTWAPDTGVVFDGKYAMHGYVPLNSGDTAELVTPWFDCSAASRVFLYFHHICKILPSDICQVLYQERGIGHYYVWKPIPVDSYLGASTRFKRDSVFNHASYADWKPADTFATPGNSWWKEDGFELSEHVGYSIFRIKFVIRKGNFVGSYFTRGWYLDAVRVIGLIPPAIVIVDPPARPTESDRYRLKVKTVSRSGMSLTNPKFYYEVSGSNMFVSDSLKMSPEAGDSIWSAIFPVLPSNAKVKYHILVADSMHTESMLTDSFVVDMTHSASLVSFEFPDEVSHNSLQPVCVTLKNKGRTNMHNAIVNWSVNGVPHFPAVYYGNLAPEATDTIVVGRYVPGMCVYDTIRAWVKMPDFCEDAFTSDDSLCKLVLGCNGSISGAYSVGEGGDYPDLQTAITRLSLCGISGQVTLKLLPGDYAMCAVIPAISGCSAKNPIVITSYTGDSSSVVLRGRRVGSTMHPPLRLCGAAYLQICNLSIFSSPKGVCDGICLEDSCHDVEITNCMISMKGGAGVKIIGKSHSNILVRNCGFVGGDYALYVSASNSPYSARNIHFKNNNVDSVRNAIYLHYGSSANVTGNRVRTFKGYALHVEYGSAEVWDNLFYSVSAPYGIRLSDFGDSVHKTGSVCNNVIRIDGDGASGISLYEKVGFVRIFHNTVYLKTNNADIYGLNINNSEKRCIMNADVRNNIFHVKSVSGGGYPVCLTGKYGKISFESNNYYHEKGQGVPYMGYYGAVCMDLDAWKKSVSGDVSSVSEAPRYYSDTDLHIAVMEGLECTALSYVPKDIYGNVRNRKTTMGAYEFVRSLSDIAVLRTSWNVAMGGSSSCMVCLKNYGKDTLTSISIGSEVNGVGRSPVRWNGVLLPESTVWVDLGVFPLHGATNKYSFYLYGWKDDVPSNDTLVEIGYVCDVEYTIGERNADFTNVEEALYYVQKYCTDQPVTLKFKSGTYKGGNYGLEFSKFQRKDNSCRLTFCSEAGCADSVVFSADDGLYLNNAAHLIFRNLTFDATNQYGAFLEGNIEDVEICHCVLKVPIQKQSVPHQWNPIGIECAKYDNTSTDYVRSLRLIGNRIEGGHRSIHLVYTALSAGKIMSSSIIIDSNELVDAVWTGIYLGPYNHVKSCSHNVVTRSVLPNLKNTSYTGIVSSSWNCVERMEGNRIHISHNEKATGIAIGASSISDSLTKNCVVANNEVVVCGAGENTGISMIGYLYCHLLHNSVYVSGSKSVMALSFDNSISGGAVAYSGDMLGNMFVADTAACVFFVSKTTFSGERDYNNYYVRSGYLAQIDGRTSNSINWIRAFDKKDQNSVSLSPVWKDTSMCSLDLLRSVWFCPKLSSVPADIKGLMRKDPTAVGCYEQFNPKYDMEATGLLGLDSLAGIGCHPISIVIANNGDLPIDTAWIHVRINGKKYGPVMYCPPMPLASGCTDTLPLGSFTLMELINNIVVWVEMTKDYCFWNDTLQRTMVLCPNERTDTIRISTFLADVPLDSLSYYFGGCSLADTVVLMFEDGDYRLARSWNLSGFRTKRLLLLSASGNRDSVRITADTSGLLRICSGPDVEIRSLTLMATEGDVVSIQDYTGNITVRNCHLVTSKQLKTDGRSLIRCKDAVRIGTVRIVGNQMEGGYQAVRFCRNECVGNLYVDSNVMTDQYAYGCFFDSTSVISCSYNSIRSREKDSKAGYVAIYADWVRIDSVMKNNIWIKADGPNGIFLQDMNMKVFVANNVIRIHGTTTATLYGLSIIAGSSAVNVCVLFNTIYATSVSSSSYFDNARCLYAYAYTDATGFVFYGNLLVGGSDHTCPFVFIGHYTNKKKPVQSNWDYNCYYGQKYLVDINGSVYISLEGFNKAQGYEQHGKFGLPSLLGDDLRTVALTRLLIPRHTSLSNDYTGRTRGAMTMPGAYDGLILQNDAELLEFTDTVFNYGVDTVRVKLHNSGTDTLTSADIAWTYNGVRQTSRQWTGILPYGASENVMLGCFVNLCNSPVNLKAYVENANMKKDSNPCNDTIVYSGAGCDTSGRSVLQNSSANLNDTLSVRKLLSENWQLGQNIPNPATGRTLVPVMLPESGTVRLQIYSAEGRLLYRGEHVMLSGRNLLTIETDGYAAGVYYYSVEYRGERKVRKMIVNCAR